MNPLAGRLGHARVVVLTVIEEEFASTKDVFGAHVEVGVSGAFGPDRTGLEDRYYPFVLAQCSDRSNMPAMESISRLLELFRPEAIVLVGIAGGIQRDGRGPNPGDVVVGKYIHYAEFTKDIEVGKCLRYYGVVQPGVGLLRHAQAIQNSLPQSDWWSGLEKDSPDGSIHPAIWQSELVSIEHIAGDPGSREQKFIVDNFDNADAVDMESTGVARALHSYEAGVSYGPEWVCVRGVSDVVSTTAGTLGENNEERKTWKPFATHVSAVMARRIVERLLSTPREPSDGDPGAPLWPFPG